MPEPRDPGLKALVQQISECFMHFEKLLRAYRMYAEGHVTVRQFEDVLFQKIRSVLHEHGELTVAVKPYQFLLGDVPVYENTDKQENFSYRFHKDGVRQLTFHDGLTPQELHAFIGITRADFESFELSDEDVITLLWKARFDKISYVVVETYMEGEEGEEGVDAVLNAMAAALLEDGAFATLSELDSGDATRVRRRLRKKDVEEIRALPELSLDSADAVARWGLANTAEQLKTENESIFQRMILLLFRVLVTQEDSAEFQSVAVVIRRICESVIGIGEYRLAARMLAKLRELGSEDRNPSGANAALVRQLYAQLQDKDMLRTLSESMKKRPPSDPGVLSELASSLSSESTPVLFDLLPTLKTPQMRSALAASLSRIGGAKAELFSSRLKDADEASASMILDILCGVTDADMVPHLKRGYANESPAIRARTLDALSERGLEHSRNFFISALKDDDASVRRQALRGILISKDRRFVKPLFELTQTDHFEGLEADEKRHLFMALGSLGRSTVFDFFSSVVSEGLIARSGNELERKVAAVWGLWATRDARATDLLKHQAGRTLTPKAVREACREALSKRSEEAKPRD